VPELRRQFFAAPDPACGGTHPQSADEAAYVQSGWLRRRGQGVTAA
jgi:hypothetical protein